MNNVYKDLFYDVVKSHIKREGINELMESLEKSDFFTAPASTKYHDAEEGGLCKHSLEVFGALCIEAEDKYSTETLAIVSLFHDVCKVGYYKIDYKNQKTYKENGSKRDEKGRFDWETVPFYTVEDKFPYGHGEKSVLLLMDKLKLSTEEMMAIRWHMGAYEGQQAWNTLSTAYEKYPLALYLHIADMKSTYLK